MWILCYEGRATHWLLSGKTYSIGRQGCDIVILDDKSISRVHMELTITEPSPHVSANALMAVMPSQMSLLSMPSAGNANRSEKDGARGSHAAAASRRLTIPPHVVSIVDKSKYGCKVSINGRAAVALTADVAVTPTKKGDLIPACTGRPEASECVAEFIFYLGSHGMSLTAKWEPLRIAVDDFLNNSDDEYERKVRAALVTCGCAVVDSFDAADAVLAKQIHPTSAIVTTMCRGKPIISLKYFDACRQRSNCKIPLPDISSVEYLPPVSEFWRVLWDGGVNTALNSRSTTTDLTAATLHSSTDANMLMRAFMPQTERRFLFSNLTFVTFQQSLFDEASTFLHASQGRIVFDNSLFAISSAEFPLRNPADKRIVEEFFARHYRQVVLITDRDHMPLKHCADFLRQTLQLEVLDYTAMITSILRTKKIVPSYPAFDVLKQAIASASSPKKHRGSENIDSGDEPRVGRKTIQGPFLDEGDEDDEDAPLLKRSRTDGGMITTWKSMDGGGTVKAAPAEEDLLCKRAVLSAKYPCWMHLANRSTVAPQSTTSSSSQKQFKKQPLAQGSSHQIIFEMELVAPWVNAATSAADADDIIPLVAPVVNVTAGGKGFNVFDVAAHHKKQHTKKGAAAAAAPAAKKPAPTRPVVEEFPEFLEQPAAPKNSKSIFDIDNFY